MLKVSTFSDVRDIDITDDPPIDEEQGTSEKYPGLAGFENDFRPHHPNGAQKLFSKVHTFTAVSVLKSVKLRWIERVKNIFKTELYVLYFLWNPSINSFLM